MTLRIQLVNNQHAIIISAYAPTLDAEDQIKEDFISLTLSFITSCSMQPRKTRSSVQETSMPKLGKTTHYIGTLCMSLCEHLYV